MIAYKDRFCLIPESSINIMPDGSITPCCGLTTKHDVVGNIFEHSLQEVFDGPWYQEFRRIHRSGELTERCRRFCVDEGNGEVHRLGRNRLVLTEIDHNNYTEGETRLISIDLGFGNVCALTCIFCSSTFSSSWAKKLGQLDQIYRVDKQTMFRDMSIFASAIELNFKGGEPFNIPYLAEFLEELYLVNPRCRISFVTNGIDCTDRLFAAISKFELSFVVSIESLGALYSYLRGGDKDHTAAFNTLRRFKSINPNFLAVSTILHLYNYHCWAEDMYTIQQEFDVEILLQLLTWPNNQSPLVLRQEHRLSLVNSIESWLKKGLRVQGIDSILWQLKDEWPRISANPDEVLAEVIKNDRFRSKRLFDIIPDFSDKLIPAKQSKVIPLIPH